MRCSRHLLGRTGCALLAVLAVGTDSSAIRILCECTWLPAGRHHPPTRDPQVQGKMNEVANAVAERASLELDVDPLLSTKAAAMTTEILLEAKV